MILDLMKSAQQAFDEESNRNDAIVTEALETARKMQKALNPDFAAIDKLLSDAGTAYEKASTASLDKYRAAFAEAMAEATRATAKLVETCKS